MDVRGLRTEAGIIQTLHYAKFKPDTQQTCASLSDITPCNHVVAVRHDPSVIWAGVQSLNRGTSEAKEETVGQE